MNLHTLNIWAVIAAAVSAFLIGGLWYSPVLLGAAWKLWSGRKQSDAGHTGGVR